MMLNIRLPDSLERALAQEAQQRNTSRSEVAREALTFYLRAQRRQRYIKRLQLAAKRLDEVEARAFAEESLVLGNEILAVAETSPLDTQDDHPWWT